MTFWRRRPGLARRRRLAEGAGLPEHVAPPERFTPTDVDEQGHRRQIEELAAGLVHSVDEATPHAMDNLINAWADTWISTADAEHSEFGIRSALALGRTEAHTALTKILWLEDVSRLVEVGVAVEAALTHLTEETEAALPEGAREADRDE